MWRNLGFAVASLAILNLKVLAAPPAAPFQQMPQHNPLRGGSFSASPYENQPPAGAIDPPHYLVLGPLGSEASPEPTPQPPTHLGQGRHRPHAYLPPAAPPSAPPAQLHNVNRRAYSYGWFGASPREHWTRHFGYYRNYIQWGGR